MNLNRRFQISYGRKNGAFRFTVGSRKTLRGARALAARVHDAVKNGTPCTGRGRGVLTFITTEERTHARRAWAITAHTVFRPKD